VLGILWILSFFELIIVSKVVIFCSNIHYLSLIFRRAAANHPKYILLDIRGIASLGVVQKGLKPLIEIRI